MNNFKIGDKVKLNSNFNINTYGIEWKRYWSKNANTIFTVSSNTSLHYYLQYLNGEEVFNPINNNILAIFFEDELELHTVNLLPDDLFDI